VAGLVELLALQGFDISIDQANHRLTHLPEIDERRSCMQVVATLESRQREIEAAIAATEDVIAKGERTTKEIDIKVKRLESQLKTVIAPREAEALQHEIATLRREREESDEHGPKSHRVWSRHVPTSQLPSRNCGWRSGMSTMKSTVWLPTAQNRHDSSTRVCSLGTRSNARAALGCW
jgi:hypothetical protein